ncbi:hypothetical protein [Streptomyces sp. 769]|uniref:hypothetical protein n=1 Tax=Streptomyces sp. 769 TaxID=1262452 RepID=UPI000581B9D1|nr:hypothetical protein [Streptomyces sp. 769]AJC59317.1 hypothetical protein GZL_06750 [Streptomyces sp. 769]
MSRRVSLPGADELFRTTGGVGLQSSAPRRTNGGPAGGEDARVPAPAGESDPSSDAAEDAPGARRSRAGAGADADAPAADDGAPGAPRTASAEHSGREAESEASAGHRTTAGLAARAEREAAAPAVPAGASGRRRGRGANRRPSGRERHDEKITVYVSAEELMDLEHARLVLRGEHGLAVDRGRIVREAVAVVLADLESRGDASILVRRLRGR